MPPEQFVTHYPRGHKEMIGPFYRFDPSQTEEWFNRHGVQLKTEKDGRMFPVTNSSQTIVDCLIKATLEKGVKLQTSCGVTQIKPLDGLWHLNTAKGEEIAGNVLVATGSSEHFWSILSRDTRHTVIDPVPSLFTFHCSDPLILGLQGVSVPDARVGIPGTQWAQRGAVMITHDGLSGPAVLRLSAIGAVWMHANQYRFDIEINWKPEWKSNQALDELLSLKNRHPKKKAENLEEIKLPSRLFESMVRHSVLHPDKILADQPRQELAKLAETLTGSRLKIEGKSTFKEEFVTAGGVNLREIDFKTFGSKLHPGLYFAGEVLNIDAVTGGFNFQAAWTGAFLAAQDMLRKIESEG